MTIDWTMVLLFVLLSVIFGGGVFWITNYAERSRSNLEKAGEGRQKVFTLIGRIARDDDDAERWKHLWDLTEDVSLSQHYRALMAGQDPWALYSQEVRNLLAPTPARKTPLRIVN